MNIQSLFACKSLKIGKVEHNEAVYWLKFPSNLKSWPKRFQKLSKTVQWVGEWDKPYQPRRFYCTKSSTQLCYERCKQLCALLFWSKVYLLQIFVWKIPGDHWHLSGCFDDLHGALSSRIKCYRHKPWFPYIQTNFICYQQAVQFLFVNFKSTLWNMV